LKRLTISLSSSITAIVDLDNIPLLILYIQLQTN
jgi:hypothetical protein